MNTSHPITRSRISNRLTTALHGITRLMTWPFARIWQAVEKHFLSYLAGRVLKDERRVYSIRFVWYNDSIYFHPMIWGSFVFFLLSWMGIVSSGWLLLLWFVGLFVCLVTILYNINVIRAAILSVGLTAFLGACYFSTIELSWNPLAAAAHHVDLIEGSVSSGFFLLSMYFFMALVVGEMVWAWLFHRVEIDESYVYEHQFMKGSQREPIFASQLARETKDLLELLLLGAADLRHQTRTGTQRFKNIPLASLWLGNAIDSLLDYRGHGQLALERSNCGDMSEDARIEDAIPDTLDDQGGESESDGFGDDIFGDGVGDDGGLDDDGIAG